MNTPAAAKTKAKAKAKPRAKGEPKPPRDDADDEEPGDGSNKRKRGRGKEGDPELDELALKRDAVIKTRKWQSAVLSIAPDVRAAVDVASAVEGGEQFAGVLKSRFEKMVAMAPEVSMSPQKRLLIGDKPHQELRESLTPISRAKANQLDAPTKKSLGEYDKTMSSMESSVNKAVAECNSYVDKIRVEQEKEKAKQERLQNHRLRTEKHRKKALEKAQAEGQQQADKEVLASGEAAEVGGDNSDASDSSDDENNVFMPIVQDGQAILERPTSPCVCQGLTPFRISKVTFRSKNDGLKR